MLSKDSVTYDNTIHWLNNKYITKQNTSVTTFASHPQNLQATINSTTNAEQLTLFPLQVDVVSSYPIFDVKIQFILTSVDFLSYKAVKS